MTIPNVSAALGADTARAAPVGACVGSDVRRPALSSLRARGPPGAQTLFCPSGYETDALYLFTPDIMARFVDHAAALDVEIVDDWLFLYARRDLVTLDPATWAWLFATVQALLDKLAQWARWRDDRLRLDTAASPPGIGATIPGLAAAAGAAASTVPFAGTAPLTPPPGVAQAGRRLKRGSSARLIAIVGIIVFTWLLAQSGLVGAIFSAIFRW